MQTLFISTMCLQRAPQNWGWLFCFIHHPVQFGQVRQYDIPDASDPPGLKTRTLGGRPLLLPEFPPPPLLLPPPPILPIGSPTKGYIYSQPRTHHIMSDKGTFIRDAKLQIHEYKPTVCFYMGTLVPCPYKNTTNAYTFIHHWRTLLHIESKKLIIGRKSVKFTNVRP